MTLALDVWDHVKSFNAAYNWDVGPKARGRLDGILGSKLPWAEMGAGAQQNQALRSRVHEALHAEETDSARAGALFEWIVCDWGGVRAGRAAVGGWAAPETGWHQGYDEATLLAFADSMGQRRVSSWSKVFAFAAPDRHAIYDSRVAVALNLALEHFGKPERFFMPPSKVYVDRAGNARPNAVARARKRLRGPAGSGYRDYLRLMNAVRAGTAMRGDPVDFLAIESTLFAAAPLMAEASIMIDDGASQQA